MHYLFSFLCVCTFLSYCQTSDFPNTYSGITACNQTIVLGSDLFWGLVDFKYEHKLLQPFPSFTCNIRIVTLPESFVAIKFLTTTNSVYVFDRRNCRTLLAIKSNAVNVDLCNDLPQAQLSGNDYMDITYKIRKDYRVHHIKDGFKMLYFTYSRPDDTNKCQNNETLCFGSNRCVNGPLICSDLYDFCNNGRRNCRNSTEVARSPEVSFTGLYILISCSAFLLAVTVYMCFCQGLHLCECTCHCCSTVTRTGNDVNNESRQTGNGNDNNEEADGDVLVATEADENTDPNVDNTSSINNVNFDLPPSYSYIERSDNISGARVLDDTEEDMTLESTLDINLKTAQRNSVELPPSYSTVLGHEEQYDVHVY